jgi:FMN phosphatase YigB (HAD superfamily)
MKHRPDKSNPTYFRSLMQYFGITADKLIYFEHNLDAIASARSLGITTYHYDKSKKDLLALKRFLDQNQ